MTTALLDADIIAFKASCVSSQGFVEVDGEPVAVGDLDQAKDAVRYLVKNWRQKARADNFFCCLSDPKNFRKELNPEYKANRKGLKRPDILNAVKDFIRETYPCLAEPMLEADDVMGIWSTNGQLLQPVIVSIDKDMQSVPGNFLNPDKMSQPVRITKAAANRYWLTQTLTGDVVDGYKGCPGVGPKKAAQLVDASSFSEAWQRVVAAYVAAGQTEADAILNAQMARILRAEDWRESTKEILVWHPTTSIILPTTRSEKSKSSTSSDKSVATTPATKPPQSQTSLSTSVGHPTRARRKRT